MTYREKLDRVAQKGRFNGRQEAIAVLLDAAYQTEGPAWPHTRAFALRVVEAINALPSDRTPEENAQNLKTYREQFTGGGVGDQTRGVSPSPAPEGEK